MKKFLCLVIALIFMAFLSHAEEAPDGKVNEVYFPYFEKDALMGFQYVLYPEKSGLLLSAYSDDAEIAVTIEKAEYDDAEGFLKNYIEGMGRYANVTNTPEILMWEADGGKTHVSYQHKKAPDQAEIYVTDAFSKKIQENMYLLIVFNSWGGALEKTEEKFFESFRLEKREVSGVCTAFLKNARADGEGNQYVSIDFCDVVYDASIFGTYAINETEETIEYTLSKDALIWGYDADEAVYTQRMIEPLAENLVQISAHYYENMGFDMIFQVLFDAKGEIVWMMHYNAF